MDYQLLYTQRALTDLAEIIAHIAEDDANAASRFGSSLLDHIDLLARFPHMGSIARRRPQVEKLLHTPFLIYYRTKDESRTVEVLHVRHGARKPPSSELRG
ncbi:MAG: type II toxin-antitoxin system RelE/ParE family toxin [Candidatus Sulfotelmatobacter sp.]